MKHFQNFLKVPCQIHILAFPKSHFDDVTLMSIWCVQNYKFCSSERVNFKISIWCLFVDLLYILSWQTTKLMSESHQNHDIIWMSYLWHQCDVHFMTQKFGVQILISVWHQPDVTICTCDIPVTCWCECYFKLTQKWCHGATWVLPVSGTAYKSMLPFSFRILFHRFAKVSTNRSSPLVVNSTISPGSLIIYGRVSLPYRIHICI